MDRATQLEAPVKRRRHPRFTLAQTWPGELKTCDDVVLEERQNGHLWITSRLVVRDNESLTLSIVGASGVLTVGVTAVGSRPSADLGLLSHRVALALRTGPCDLLEQLPRASAPAVLWRASEISAVELSRRGCLLTSPVAAPVGALGVLRVSVAPDRTFVDGIRVVWCRPTAGAATFRIGAELIPIMREETATNAESLCGIVSRLEHGHRR